MKQNYVAFSICLICLTLAGCGATVQSPVIGLLYTNVKAPVAPADISGGERTSGHASATSILGLFAFGDASIDAAVRDGDITDIHYVDYESKSFLGIVATFTVTVYGSPGLRRMRYDLGDGWGSFELGRGVTMDPEPAFDQHTINKNIEIAKRLVENGTSIDEIRSMLAEKGHPEAAIDAVIAGIKTHE